MPASATPPPPHRPLRLLKLVLPMLLQSLALMMLPFVSTMFVGHLNDPLALSAVVLSSSLYNVSGISMTLGLASAMDTLCGQVRHWDPGGWVQAWGCCVVHLQRTLALSRQPGVRVRASHKNDLHLCRRWCCQAVCTMCQASV